MPRLTKGLTPRLLSPLEDHLLLTEFGYGLVSPAELNRMELKGTRRISWTVRHPK